MPKLTLSKEIQRSVLSSVPPYSGNSASEYQTFVDCIESLDSMGYTKDDMYAYARGKLTGLAGTSFNQHQRSRRQRGQAPVQTWKRLKAYLRQTNPHVSDAGSRATRRELAQLRLANLRNPTYDSYLKRFQTLRMNAYDVTDSTLKDYFLDGLPSSLARDVNVATPITW